jgi:alpha-ketoglutarate-dependent taurine dioxygenase
MESLAERARSETMEEFPWHTDCSYEACPPRFFALQVLQPDRCGGGTLSVLEVAKLLSHLSPAARQQLAQPEYEMRVPPEFVKDGGGRTIVGSILAPDMDETCPQVRFRDDIITPLTPGATRAFQELKDILGSPWVKEQILHLTPQQLPEGSIIIIDNRRWLHARNHVRDPNRHLRRIRWDAQAFGTSVDTL